MGKTTLFYNGEILTANGRDELAEAMLIEDGHIVFVGDGEEAAALADSDTTHVDLEKRSIVPGFINTYPTDFETETAELNTLEETVRERLSVGWTALRLSHGTLVPLRRLVAEGRLTASVAPFLFALYERAEMLAERCRFIHIPEQELWDEAAVRRAEWAASDRRPIALESSGDGGLFAVRSFLAALSSPPRGSSNRLYLSTALSEKHFSLLLSMRLLPVFLSADRASSSSLLALRERGLPAVLAATAFTSPLCLLSEVLSPLGDDYRCVPPLLSALTLHAASLESVSSEIGSLEWGKSADFLILSAPLLGCPPSRLSELRVTECWIGGQRLACS